MESNISSKKIMINYGALLGIVTVLFSVILYATGMYKDPHWTLSILSFLIFLVPVILGIRAYKSGNNGYLTLPDALKTGIGIALIGGLIGGLWNLTLTQVIEPDYMEQVLQMQQEKIAEQFPDYTEEQIEQSMAIGRKMSSPIITFAIGIIGSLFMGFIVSLISGLIMQKKEELY